MVELKARHDTADLLGDIDSLLAEVRGTLPESKRKLLAKRGFENLFPETDDSDYIDQYMAYGCRYSGMIIGDLNNQIEGTPIQRTFHGGCDHYADISWGEDEVPPSFCEECYEIGESDNFRGRYYLENRWRRENLPFTTQLGGHFYRLFENEEKFWKVHEDIMNKNNFDALKYSVETLGADHVYVGGSYDDEAKKVSDCWPS